MPDIPSLETPTSQSTVIRTSRGPSLAGTRVTLYSLMDYLHAGWPPHLIRDEFALTDAQITAAVEYIEKHREEVETEYRAVLQQAEENRKYWELRNKARAVKVASPPSTPTEVELRARLNAAKARLGMS